MDTFTDWLLQNLESTAFTRSRMAALLGTGPKKTDADMLGGHSTNPLFGKKATKNPLKKKKKKKKVAKGKKKTSKKKT